MARRKSLCTFDMSYDEVADHMAQTDVIMIPIGSNEKHGSHCVLGTDSMTTTGVVRIAAEVAQVLYTPIVPVGYSPHHMGEMGKGSGTMTFSGDTFRAIVYELGMSMVYHGYNKIVFVSHHGSNSKVVDDVLRRLRYETGGFFCWYKTPTERDYDIVGDIMEACADENTLVAVLSDHAAFPMEWNCDNLYKAFSDAGLLVYRQNDRGEYEIDWSQTRACPNPGFHYYVYVTSGAASRTESLNRERSTNTSVTRSSRCCAGSTTRIPASIRSRSRCGAKTLTFLARAANAAET